MAAMAKRERVFEAVADAIWGVAAQLTPNLIDEAYRVTDRVLEAINQTDDGAAPGQGLGGSTPAAAAPSSLSDEAGRPGPDLIGGQPDAASSLPRSFQLIRHHDPSGVSGTGLVAEGTQFRDGAAALRWYGAHPSTVAWPSVDDIVAVHGHGGATVLKWLDTSS